MSDGGSEYERLGRALADALREGGRVELIVAPTPPDRHLDLNAVASARVVMLIEGHASEIWHIDTFRAETIYPAVMQLGKQLRERHAELREVTGTEVRHAIQ